MLRIKFLLGFIPKEFGNELPKRPLDKSKLQFLNANLVYLSEKNRFLYKNNELPNQFNPISIVSLLVVQHVILEPLYIAKQNSSLYFQRLQQSAIRAEAQQLRRC